MAIFAKRLLALVALLSLLSIPTAQASEDEPDMILKVNEGKLQKLNMAVVDILITNPNIADIQLTQGNGIFVYGKKPGRTHIMALAEGDRIVFSRHIQVTRDLKSLVKLFTQLFPGNNVRLTSSPGRLIVTGDTSTPLEMDHMISLIEGYLEEGEKIVNQLIVKSPLQVNLRVQIMEMNRAVTKEIGINWDILLNPGSFAVGLVTGRNPIVSGNSLIPDFNLNGTGSSGLIGVNGSRGSVSAVIDALVEDNLISVLAEPNLTSRSGETASFFAGGEFPIPIAAEDNRITVEFKKFGVKLDMTPTVISPNRISLHIRPEVSELSTNGAVVIQNINIPGISVRRTEATIELASGQSFSVAGLLQNKTRNLIRDVPWLGDIDVLGPLFKSSKYQKSETELVIIATANIVKPLSVDNYVSPLDGVRTQNDSIERQKGHLIRDYPNREKNNIKTPGGGQLIGPRGYIY